MSRSMKALLLSGTGFEQFALAECEAPRPRAGEVLLRMRAAGITLRDYKIVTGAYGSEGQTRPLIPGGEGVGEIVELGDGVRGFEIGQRVSPLFVQGWVDAQPKRETIAAGTLGGPILHGCYGEYLAVRADSVVEAPEHLSDVEAATLPFAGVAAWRTIHEQGGIGRGDTVVIQGTGGIPLFALQFAKQAGARVILTSKSDDKLERARQLGADHVINYANTPDWAQAVLDLTSGEGADLVLDPGGSATIAQSVRSVRPCGAISVFNALGAADIGLNLPYLLGHNLRVHGVNAGSLIAHRKAALAMSMGKLRPVIENIVGLAEGPEAVARAPKAEQFGKVCLQFDLQKIP